MTNIRPNLAAAVVGTLFINVASSQATELTLAQNQSPISGVTMVAKELGYFEEAGLAVNVSAFTSGREALNSVLGGSADIATTAEAPTTAAAMGGQPIAFLARTEYSDLKTLTRTAANIEALPDLEGATIGYAAGTGSEVYTSTLLDEADVPASDVQLVNMRPTEMLSALASGSIDAFNVWEPHIINAKTALGDDVKELDTSGIYAETFNIVTMKDYMNDNPGILKAFMEALIKAEEWMESNEESAIDIVSTAADMPRDTLMQTWDEYVYEVVVDDFTLDILEKHAAWRSETGNKPSPDAELPPFDQFIFPEVLESIDPSRVTADI